MKGILGITMIIGGVALGLYIGLYVMLFGGIVDVVNFFRNNLESSVLGWAVVKIFCAGTCGVLSSYLLILPGIALIANSK